MAVAEHQDDDELIRRLLDRRADLLAYLRAIGPADLAEDAFQETFLVVHRRLADFRRDGDFLAWVRGIARLTVRRLAEKRQRWRPLPDDIVELIDRAVDEEPTDSPHDDLPALRRCIEALTEVQRRILHLRYGQGEPVEAIAGSVGRTPGAVHVVLTRLRAALGDCVSRRRREP